MSLTTVLKASTFVGAGYAAQCLFMTDKYLEDQKVENTPQTRYMVRGIAGGVVGIVTASYFAAFTGASEEFKKAIALANISAFTVWTLSCINQVVNVASDAIGPKVDLGICTVMLSSFVGALAM